MLMEAAHLVCFDAFRYGGSCGFFGPLLKTRKSVAGQDCYSHKRISSDSLRSAAGLEVQRARAPSLTPPPAAAVAPRKDPAVGLLICLLRLLPAMRPCLSWRG